MIETNKPKSYIAIVKSAKSLFWKYGIRKVTVEEICKEAGVSKMTFYRNFNNKKEVAEQVVDELVGSSVKRYKSIMQQEVDFTKKIKQLIAFKHQESKDISPEFLKDIYQNDDSHLYKRIEAYRKQNLNEIIKDFEAAQKKGWIRKDLKMSFILYILNSLNEKMKDETFLALYRSPTEAIMELTNFFFYGILPDKDHS